MTTRRRLLGQSAALILSNLVSPRVLAGSTGNVAPLGAPTSDGVRLPAGFSARLIARTGQALPGRGYVWHGAPDGGACFPRPEGGWVYVSNAELDAEGGGVGVACFDSTGALVDGWTILEGTTRNCAGGPTPWGTWLSCEEHPRGRVHECDPLQPGQGAVRPLLGAFAHEAAAVDPVTGHVFLTEDDQAGRLYRFSPRVRGRLDAGELHAAHVDAQGRVTWHPAAPDRPCRTPETTAFARGEGAWFGAGRILFSTTQDHRLWAYDPGRESLTILYDGLSAGAAAPLHWPDNLTIHPGTGQVYVAEDGDDLQINRLILRDGETEVVPFLQFVGHPASEVTGPAFSPDGRRLYVSSQRGQDGQIGMTFEITGPFARI